MTAEIVKDAIVVRDGVDWAAAIPAEHGGWFIVDAFSTQRYDDTTRAAIGRCTGFIEDCNFTAVWRGIYTKLRTGLRARYEIEYPYAPSPL